MKKKQTTNFNDTAEEARSALQDLLGDDEDAIELEMEEMVYPMLERETESDWDSFQLDMTGFAQVGSADYWEKQKFEGDFLKKRIVFLLGPPPDGLRIEWKGYPHDFGTYHSICVRLDWENDSHVKYFNKMEDIDGEPLEEEMAEIWEQEKSGKLEEDNKVFNLLKPESDVEPDQH